MGVEPLLLGNSKLMIVKFKIYALPHILHKSITRMFSVSGAHRGKKILYTFYLFLFFPSSWSRGMGFSTAKSATSGGRVLMYGASLEPVRLVATCLHKQIPAFLLS